MIWFLIKGVVRDRSRSLFPVIIVAAGTALTVLMYSWVAGAYSDMLGVNARLITGHLKVMTRAYAEDADQMPNDLAVMDLDKVLDSLRREYPDIAWKPRIRFGGLLDVPDENGETRVQGIALCTGLQLLSDKQEDKKWSEIELFKLRQVLKQGRLPEKQGEVLLSDQFARKLNVSPGETVTLITSTMYGAMTIYNFTLAGTVHFGIGLLDNKTMITDLLDAQRALQMENAAGEIFGIFKNDHYDDHLALQIQDKFNSAGQDEADEFQPVMQTMTDQQMLREMMNVAKIAWGIIIGIFLTAMAIVLWNVGILGGLRRYGEVGVRLAMGETKGHIYRSMLAESLITAAIGSLIGTIIGLAAAYYLQYAGWDISAMMKNASMVMNNVIHARVTVFSYLIGFIPGILATLLGTALSGIGIYRRQTAQLFKELEV